MFITYSVNTKVAKRRKDRRKTALHSFKKHQSSLDLLMVILTLCSGFIIDYFECDVH